MFASFLNLRKRLLIRHLSVVALVALSAPKANAALSLTEQMFQRIQDAANFNETTSNFNTTDLVDVFNKDSAVKRAAYEERHRSQINNISFVNALWTLPSTELMGLNFAGRSALAPDATFRDFGFANQSDLDRFRKMLTALRDDMIKQGKSKVLSLEDIEKLAQLLAQGKTTDGELSIEGIDKELLAAVQANAKTFEAADSPEARQAAMAAFTEALGSLAENSAASEAGELLGSAHGALESHNIQDSFNLLQQDTSSGSDQMLAALGGNLFSDLNLNTQAYIDEDKMASNSGATGPDGKSLNNAWVPKGMTDELLKQQRTAALGNFRGFNSGSAPTTATSPEEDQGRRVTSGLFDRSNPSDEGEKNDSGKVLASGKAGNHQGPTSDTQIKNRLGEITQEQVARQPASVVPPTQTTPEPIAPKAEPVATVDPLLKEAALMSVADAGVAELAEKEAKDLGMTDPKKIEEYKNAKVQTAVEQFIRENPPRAPSHTAVASLSETEAKPNSTNASNGETPIAQACPSPSIYDNRDAQMKIFDEFAKGTRDIHRDQDHIKLKTAPRLYCDAECMKNSPKTDISVDAQEIAAVEIMSNRERRNISPESILKHALAGPGGTTNPYRMLELIADKALPKLKAQNWCPKGKLKNDEIHKLSQAYSEALYELMTTGTKPVIALDSSGCPKTDRYGSDDGAESARALTAFFKYEVNTNVGLQNLAPSIKADPEGVSYCSTLELDPQKDAGLNSSKLASTFIGSLLSKCRASFQPIADRAFENFQKNQSLFNEKKGSSSNWLEETDVARRRCMEHRLSLATLKAFKVHHNEGATRNDRDLMVESEKHGSATKARGI